MKKLEKKELGTSSETRALITDEKERRGKSRNRRSSNQFDRSDKTKEISKSRRKNIKCYHCDKTGYLKRM